MEVKSNTTYGNGTGLYRAVRAFKCSMLGLKAAIKYESAFRQELFLSFFFIPFGFWIGQDLTQKLFLVSLVIAVLVVELLNSAIESVVDRVGVEYHELSGRAKDLGSAAVMLMLILTGASFFVVALQAFGRS